MAKETVIFCDKCESREAEASRTLLVLGSNRYQADLCDACLQQVIEAVLDLVPTAIEVSRSSSNVKASAIRLWAAENGIEVGVRGKIKAEIRERYDMAMTKAAQESQPVVIEEPSVEEVIEPAVTHDTGLPMAPEYTPDF